MCVYVSHPNFIQSETVPLGVSILKLRIKLLLEEFRSHLPY